MIKPRYRHAVEGAGESGEFFFEQLVEAALYLARNPDVAAEGIDPWQHYIEHGRAEGRLWERPQEPMTDVEAALYLAQNADVAAAGLDPWLHFFEFGKAEGRAWPLNRANGRVEEGPAEDVDYQLVINSGLFDRDFYLSNNPDVLNAGIDPLAHYLEIGANEGRSPNPLFDGTWYLRLYADVAASGCNPLLHYVKYGGMEGRCPHPLFDGRFYLSTYPDVAAAAINPLLHYLKHGGLEGLCPNPLFDCSLYLRLFPEVTANGINPLVHYLETAGLEGRGLNTSPHLMPLNSIVKIKEALILSPSEIMKIADAIGPTPMYEKIVNTLRHPMVRDWLILRRTLQSQSRQPKISVIMPVYNTDPTWLSLAIESVLAQIYDNWELCIVDDCSPSQKTRDVIREFAERDHRIRIDFRNVNGHISNASNDCLRMASGDYIGLLDHDDELTPDALAKVVIAINKQPDAVFIYSDEDKVDEAGVTYGRAFKPAWSPEFILACGYTTHFSVYSAEILKRVGGFRSEFDGAQDYDLTLRVSELTDRIAHIPEVLYHWRASATSTAKSNGAKSYAFPRAKNALQQHMDRLGVPGLAVEGRLKGYTGFNIALQSSPVISIVIPTAGKVANINGYMVNLIENCVESVQSRSSYRNYELIVMENGNLSASTTERLTNHGARLERYSEPKFNLAQKMNFGAAYASGDYLVFMNDDTEVISPDWLEHMLRFCQLDGVGIVGAKLLFADNTIQHIGVSVIGGAPGHAMYGYDRHAVGHLGLATTPHNVAAVTGACMMTKSHLFKEVSGFDEIFDLNYNDVDYCLRIRAKGRRIVMNPLCELYHYESVSRESKGTVRPDEFATFYKRWGSSYENEMFLRV